MKTTFIDWRNTNARVFEKANQIKHPDNCHKNSIIKPFSEYVCSQQNQLLAHTVRAPDSDPLRQCTLSPSLPFPIQYGSRRVGRPRMNWTWACYENMYCKNICSLRNMFSQQRQQNVLAMLPKIKDKTIKT